jgi:hypothetical protein
LIDETVKFGVQLIRYVSDPRAKPAGREKESFVPLVTVLFNTLTEFCKGSLENQLSVVDSKGLILLRKVLKQFGTNIHPMAMDVKVMTYLPLS